MEEEEEAAAAMGGDEPDDEERLVVDDKGFVRAKVANEADTLLAAVNGEESINPVPAPAPTPAPAPAPDSRDNTSAP